MGIVSGGGGRSQPFVRIALRHSAAFANAAGSAPVTSNTASKPGTAITLPPSAVGNASIIDVLVDNSGGTAAVLIGGSLVVQNADGTIWIEQDTSADQTVAPGTTASIAFDTNGGSAGAGLSWNPVTKQVEIANAGVYSAFVTLYALTA